MSGARVDDDGERTVAVAEPAGVSVPDSDILQADACAPAYKFDSLSRIILGLCRMHQDDFARIQAGMNVFDALYASLGPQV